MTAFKSTIRKSGCRFCDEIVRSTWSEGMAKHLSRVEREGIAREKLMHAGTCRSIAADLPEQAQKAILEKYAGKLERAAAQLHPGVSLLIGAA